ncbi:hypothetical protein A9498_28930 (plasmid) [Bacillus thuringiensis serovar coreanensis]|nr:hypothetical protein A9498_28930 [Bacillus thuringiensis serovar coreanensis]
MFNNAFSIIQNNSQYYKDFTFTEAVIDKGYPPSVEADGSPTITDSSSLFVGRTTLTNNTN